VMGNEWANPEATKNSLGLIARRVMPEFQRSTRGLRRAVDHALESHDVLYKKQEEALFEMNTRHASDVAARAASA